MLRLLFIVTELILTTVVSLLGGSVLGEFVESRFVGLGVEV